METSLIRFSVRLAALRKARGLSQSRLAAEARKGNRIAGLTAGSLSHWEEARRLPSPGQLLALTRVLVPSAEAIVPLLDLAAEISPAYRIGDWWRYPEWPPDRRYQDWQVVASTYPTRPARGVVARLERS